MDPKLLADAVTMFLAPALPYLVKGGEGVVRETGKKIGEEGWELAKKLWQKLQSKPEVTAKVDEAVHDVAADPADTGAQAALSHQLKKLLAADPELAAELARLVEGARSGPTATVHGSGAIAQGPGAVAAGAGGLAIGGSVQGGVHWGGRQAPPEPEGDE